MLRSAPCWLLRFVCWFRLNATYGGPRHARLEPGAAAGAGEAAERPGVAHGAGSTSASRPEHCASADGPLADQLEINFNYNMIDDNGLIGLSECSYLERVHLGYESLVHVTAKGLMELRKCPRLRIFEHAIRNDQEIEALAMPSMELIALADENVVTDVGLACLANCPRLRSLNIGNFSNESMTDAGLGVLRYLPELMELILGFNHPFTDAAIQNLQYCPALVNIRIEPQVVDPENCESICLPSITDKTFQDAQQLAATSICDYIGKPDAIKMILYDPDVYIKTRCKSGIVVKFSITIVSDYKQSSLFNKICRKFKDIIDANISEFWDDRETGFDLRTNEGVNKCLRCKQKDKGIIFRAQQHYHLYNKWNDYTLEEIRALELACRSVDPGFEMII